MKEHNKVKRRLEKISNPEYVVSLKKDFRTTEEEIKQQDKLKKQLKTEEQRRAKKIDTLGTRADTTDALTQAQDAAQRLAIVAEKLQTVDEENEKARELRSSQIDQLGELKSRLQKLNQIASHYGVSLEQAKLNKAEDKQAAAQLEALSRQKRILQ